MALFKTIKLVKAGRAGAVLPAEFKDIDTERIKLYLDDIKNTQMFCVVGESMSPEGIHTDNILFTHEIKIDDDINEILNQGDFIILRIPDSKDDIPANTSDVLQFVRLKIRKYITTLNLHSSYEELWDKVCAIDDLSKVDDADAIFRTKYEQAICNIPDKEKEEVLLSITYTAEHGREYSFHSRKFLYAKVSFYIDNNNKKIDTDSNV